MSDETPRAAASSTPRGAGAGRSAARVAPDASVRHPSPAPLRLRARVAQAGVRPRPRAGERADPPPAPMPRVPGMDAFLAAPSSIPSSGKRVSSPPAVSPVDDTDTDTGWATPVPPLAEAVVAERPSALKSTPRAIPSPRLAANHGAR